LKFVICHFSFFSIDFHFISLLWNNYPNQNINFHNFFFC
jgi:hypothetical protein